MKTVEDLSQEIDPETALDGVIEIVRDLGFDTTTAEQQRKTGWSAQGGSFLLVTITIAAKLWVYLSRGSAARTLAMRLETAIDTALDWWCVSQYQEKRKAAVTTRGIFLLTDSKGVGPITFTASRYVFKDPVTGATFRNYTAPTLPAKGTVEISVECEQDGAIGNSPNGRVTQLVTSVSGVTVNNPAQLTTGTWITRTGINRESNTAYKRRASLKWSTLGPNAPKSAYEWFALNALNGAGNDVGITKVKCSPPNGFGLFNVYIANDVATATPTQVTDVQTWINARKNPTAQATVVAATAVSVNQTINIVCARGTGAAASAQAKLDTETYINSLPINGAKVNSTAVGYVLVAEMLAACMAVPGVINATPTSSVDIALSVSQVAVPGTITIAYTEV